MDHAVDFIRRVFGSSPPDTACYLFMLPVKHAVSVKKVGGSWPLVDDERKFRKAIDTHIADAQNIYVGCGVANPDKRTWKGRPSADQILGITAVWADVDVENEVHKKTGLPKNADHAFALLDNGGIPRPTVTVNSGHGLQLWWALDEYWSTPDDLARAEAAAFVQGFQTRLRGVLGQMDATHDLARIMRLPGTTNFKGSPVPCEIADIREVTFTRDELAECVERVDIFPIPPTIAENVPESPQDERQRQGGGITLREDARAPEDKIALLRENFDGFSDIWFHEFRKFASQSERDMAIANACAAGGFTDQEIADTIVENRRANGQDLKLRLDYYRTTIGKARKNATTTQADNFIARYDEDVRAAEPAPETGIADERKDAALAALREKLRIDIRGIIKHMSEPPAYSIVIGKSTAYIGGIDSILNMSKFKARVAEVSNFVITKVDPKTWPAIAQMLIDIRTEQEVGAESTDFGRAQSWVIDYLGQQPIADALVDDVFTMRTPYRDGDGGVCIFGSRLQEFIHRHLNERIGAKEFGRLMRLVNFESKTVARKGTSASVWKGHWKGVSDHSNGDGAI